MVTSIPRRADSEPQKILTLAQQGLERFDKADHQATVELAVEDGKQRREESEQVLA